MRFDTTEIGDVWTEICAYGTAVQAIGPVTDAARYTAQQLGYKGSAVCPPGKTGVIYSAQLVCR